MWISHEICQILCGFHEICWILCGFHEFSRFQVKSSRFQVKSGRFHADFMKSGRFKVKSTYKTYKSNISRKTLQFYGVLWESYIMFSHEIHRISKDQLPGMVSPMFYLICTLYGVVIRDCVQKTFGLLFL